MNVRRAVAAAVNAAAIPGVTGSEWAPRVITSGVCWAQYAGADAQQYGDGTVDQAGQDWDVVLALPTGTSEATGTAMDEWIPLLLSAVSPLGRLGRVEPAPILLTEKTTRPGIRVRLTITT